MTTLVVGATGLVGFEVCRLLRERGAATRALVRNTSDPGKREELQRMGADVSEGDLKDPGSLARACAGVQAVISTASSTLSRQAGDSIASVDEHGQLALVDAARKANVRRFVFVSFSDTTNLEYPLVAAKRAVERRLGASGMTYTILQPSNFMEVWLSAALGFDAAHGKVRLYGDGTKPVSWISFKDVARATASAAVDGVADNMVVQLAGPQRLSPREVVGMFEAAGAGAIAIESVPESALEAQVAGAADPLEKSFAGLMLRTARGDEIDSAISTRLFPFAMTSVGEFVAAQLARS